MLIILSPSKTQQQDFDAPCPGSFPLFPEEVDFLVGQLKLMSPDELGRLMGISDKLTTATHEKFRNFSFSHDQKHCSQALKTFTGDVFSRIEDAEYNGDDFHFAQKHLCILSGLYGLLRPTDLMQPYRLEIGSRFSPQEGLSLYDFWRQKVTSHINRELNTADHPILLNLASLEYFKMLDQRSIDGTIINVEFKENKEGKLRTVAIHAKRARGAMVNHIIRNRIEEPADLSAFSHNGYHYSSDSTDRQLLFVK